MLNVTAVRPDRQGFLTVFPCTPEVPLASNVNYFAGDISPNSVLAKLSDDGKVCIYSYGTTHAIVDVTGYVPSGGAPVPVDPARLVETRVGPAETTVDGQYQGTGRVGAGAIVRFKVAGRGNVPVDAAAAYLNVTAIRPSGPGWLTVFPCTPTVPGSSNVNYVAGDISPNAVLATLSPDGDVCIYTEAESHIIADVNAYLPPGGNRVSIEPARCADTRIPNGRTFDGLFQGDGKIAAGGTYVVKIAGRCNIAGDASAAYLNVTAANAEAIGYLTVWPCDEQRPGTSNVNYQPGPAQPNGVLAKISLDGNGNVCIYSQARTDVIVDANGYVPRAGFYGIEQVAAGLRTTCVLLSDGTVRCAGLKGYTGDGTLGPDYPLPGGTYDPVEVVGISNATMIEAGENQTCAVLADSTARCWGQNNHGQLGDGTDVGTDGDAFDRRFAPVQVGTLDGIIDISIWADHACAITDDDGDGTGDTVWCWGWNNYRQLGDGTNEDRFSPVQVQGLPAGVAPVDVEAGGSHTCLLLADETVSCWGSGGRLGRGAIASAGLAPGPVPGVTGAVDISVGRNHTCVVLTGGTVSCWGQNESNVLTNRDAAVIAQSPATVTGVSGAIEVTAGYSSTCVRHGDGTAKCWGANQYGQLGDGSPNPDGEVQPVFMNTGSASAITAVSSNYHSWCALLADTSVVCWGYYFHGNLGVGLLNHTSTPVVYGSGDLRP
jgi:alpha-tubulin suppressor-like RCC1 family protein